LSKNLLEEMNREKLRKNFLKYTRKAFKMLPEMNHPSILDVGCGSGIPTIELSKLSNGKIIALDNDQPSLDKLNKKIGEKKLDHRIKTKLCSFLEMDFPNESFDLIWAEGVGYFIKFEKCLQDWKRYLKVNGCLVIHDDIKVSSNNLTIIPNYGFDIIDYFKLPKEAWWIDYYEPLEIRINELRTKYVNDPEALTILQKHQKEIETVKKILQKHVQCFTFYKRSDFDQFSNILPLFYDYG
jgi:ubiquinone/menaquinone biosynthesis C-methylase UbiE